MAKSVGSACAQIAILLTIYGSIHCVNSLLTPTEYSSHSSPHTTNIHPHDVVLLSPAQVQRMRRAAPAAPAESTPVVAMVPHQKNQYESISPNASVNVGSTGSIAYDVHNVGVNGTGQRKDLTASANVTSSINTSINAPAAASAAVPAPAAAAGQTPVASQTPAAAPAPVAASPAKKTQLMAAQQPSPSQQQQYPKKVVVVPVGAATTSTSTERPIIDEVDVPEEIITKEVANQTLKSQEDHFDYYRSLLYVSKDEVAALWSQMVTIRENNMLSSSHRRAMTVELTFDFPFYGHYVRNVTVATGGFLYTGEYVHSWLAATQYIAPLMANFDTSLSDDSFVRLQDNGTAFTVVWENVTLQDKPDYGNFTFSATLHQNGDITFVYYRLPTLISNILDSQHPVKVGLSDAYIVDKMLYFARRKTIFEYHRVSFGQQEITNNTIIMLTALPTCLDYHDCQSCMNHNTTFQCAWCPTLNRCSTATGNDRMKQLWQQKGCDRTSIAKIEQCPPLGKKGNNATQEQSGSKNSNNGGVISTTPSAKDVTESTVSSTQSSVSNAVATDTAKEKSEHLDAVSPENKNVGVAFGFMVPICLVFAVTLWLFYAYRNPHTRSGQLLIQSKHLHQFRPSQWSWRRGEARYTAATIHM
ncbi:plexin domain-containing protein 2 isoform X1 [Drosophila sulfurigaster albostrigata]|uniref:plexin domain-containing protein 2 isoform X1 n=1 Tax=Drosophila sulfurigaster albostrigata TaxID=89887 RepID=UPI002D2192ED|nr:plexin domain-containing protein 2 isoform X1 [Drosophila sulfurigaster albostrigata]